MCEWTKGIIYKSLKPHLAKGVYFLGEIRGLVHRVHLLERVFRVCLLKRKLHSVAIWRVLYKEGESCAKGTDISVTYNARVEGDLAVLNHVRLVVSLVVKVRGESSSLMKLVTRFESPASIYIPSTGVLRSSQQLHGISSWHPSLPATAAGASLGIAVSRHVTPACCVQWRNNHSTCIDHCARVCAASGRRWERKARGIAEIGGKTAECIGALSSLIPSSRSSDVTRSAPAEDVTRGSSGIPHFLTNIALTFQYNARVSGQKLRTLDKSSNCKNSCHREKCALLSPQLWQRRDSSSGTACV